MNLPITLDVLKPAIIAALNADHDDNGEFDPWVIEHVAGDFSGETCFERQKVEHPGDKCERNKHRTLKLEITLHSGFDVPEPEIHR